MHTERQEMIARDQKIVAGLIILCLVTTVLFFTYKGEKLIDMALPQKQVTYYKISDLKQEEQAVMLQTIKVYKEKTLIEIVQESDNQCECNEEDIKKYD